MAVCFRRQTQLTMNRSWSRTLIVAMLQWLDYENLAIIIIIINLFGGC